MRLQYKSLTPICEVNLGNMGQNDSNSIVIHDGGASSKMRIDVWINGGA